MVYVEKSLFVPIHVYEDWLRPILEDKTYIKNEDFELLIYNLDDEGVNCRVIGPEDKIEHFTKSLLELIEHANILNQLNP
jgi:hypothetical protein